MKPLRIFLLLAVAPLCLSACLSSPRATHEHAARELFPLQVGRFWVYEITHGGQTTQVENAITASHRIGEREWFLSEEFGEKFWIRNSAEGQVEAVNLYSKGEQAAIFEQLDPKTIREELLFRFPAREGDSWMALENRIRYEGKRVMATPAGTFECHLYSITGYLVNPSGDTYSHSCIAENIGVIYSDNTLPNGSLEVARLQRWGHR